MSKDYQKSRIPIEFKEYIFYNHGSFSVKNDKNGVMVTFGRFSSQEVACAAAGLLIKHEWNILAVSDDLLFEFEDKFYVFKVMNNKLIFDKDFDTFETAVEYSEINSGCNDYHNDIFKSSVNKKKGYKDRWKETEKPVETDLKHIFNQNDHFIIKKSNRRDSHVFAEFDSLNEAKAARKLLIDSNWRISDGKEIVFFENYYWVFEVNDDYLKYLGKCESYDDTFDIINPVAVEENENDDLDSKIDEYYKRKEKKRQKQKQHQKKRKVKPISSSKSKVKSRRSADEKQTPVNISRIWDPIIKYKQVKFRHYTFNIVKSSKNTSNLVAVFNFDIFKNKIGCEFNGVKIPWEKRFNNNLFKEFKLFFEIFERNYWDIHKINESSSIYYHDYLYYKIRVVSNDTIIFNTFDTYAEAERTPLAYNRKVIEDFKPVEIDKIGDKYEVVKFHGGNVLKIHPLKSLEYVKIIRDILNHLNWDMNEFKKYDLFYLNGLYWELQYINHEITLVNKYESVKVI